MWVWFVGVAMGVAYVLEAGLKKLAPMPRASELLNHLGSSSRKYCRMCMVRKIQDLFYICI